MASSYLLTKESLKQIFEELEQYDEFDVCELEQYDDSNMYDDFSLCVWEFIREEEDLLLLLGKLLIPVKPCIHFKLSV